jgi:hypothetical protein
MIVRDYCIEFQRRIEEDMSKEINKEKTNQLAKEHQK